RARALPVREPRARAHAVAARSVRPLAARTLGTAARGGEARPPLRHHELPESDRLLVRDARARPPARARRALRFLAARGRLGLVYAVGQRRQAVAQGTGWRERPLRQQLHEEALAVAQGRLHRRAGAARADARRAEAAVDAWQPLAARSGARRVSRSR